MSKSQSRACQSKNWTDNGCSSMGGSRLVHLRDAPKGKAPWALAPKRRKQALTSVPKTFVFGHSPLQLALLILDVTCHPSELFSWMPKMISLPFVHYYRGAHARASLVLASYLVCPLDVHQSIADQRHSPTLLSCNFCSLCSLALGLLRVRLDCSRILRPFAPFLPLGLPSCLCSPCHTRTSSTQNCVHKSLAVSAHLAKGACALTGATHSKYLAAGSCQHTAVSAIQTHHGLKVPFPLLHACKSNLPQ